MLSSGSVTPFRAAIGGGVILQLGLLATAVLATNPDYNFPGVVELALWSAACAVLALAALWPHLARRVDTLAAGVLVASWVAVLLRYLSALTHPSSRVALQCLDLGGVASVECLLQLSFWEHHGLRQLLFHATAVLLFLAAARTMRLAGSRASAVLPVFLLTPLVFALAAVAPKFILGQETLAGWNLVANAFSGTARSAGGLTSNPGWLWPLLAPAGALAVGLVAGTSGWRAVFGGSVLLAILFAVFDTGQRGGHVLMLLLVVSAVVTAGLWRWRVISTDWRWQMLAWFAPIGLGVLSLMVGASYVNDLLGWLSQFDLFASFSGRTFELSDTSVRGFMWRCAWNNVEPVLWSGNGYGSWLRVASAMCPGTPFIFDTAHNLWMQMLFELGAAHTVAVAGVFAWFLYQALIVSTVRAPEVSAAVLTLVAAFALVSFVQEVDYIPATYYGFAVVAGVLWGASEPKRAGVARDLAGPVAPTAGRRTAALALAAVVALAGSLAYGHSVSWGGYTFVPSEESGFLFHRWFRPHGAVISTPRPTGHAFSVLPFGSDMRGRLTFSEENGRAAVTPTGVTLENAPGGGPRRYEYSSMTKVRFLSRQNAFDLLLPPLPSDFILLSESGTSFWERAENGAAEKWCRLSCAVDVAASAVPAEGLNLSVYVDQLCTSPARPARVHYGVDVLRRGRLVREHEGQLVFTSAGSPQSIPLPAGTEHPELWRVTLDTNPACVGEVPRRGRSGYGFDGARLLFGRGVPRS